MIIICICPWICYNHLVAVNHNWLVVLTPKKRPPPLKPLVVDWLPRQGWSETHEKKRMSISLDGQSGSLYSTTIIFMASATKFYLHDTRAQFHWFGVPLSDWSYSSQAHLFQITRKKSFVIPLSYNHNIISHALIQCKMKSNTGFVMANSNKALTLWL